ncbi:hypothetical protein DY000_02007876 [Brassica cretica]|uniref:Uncharacterized protein n=1 Tax=Brassica cretica TaxID=69181 RepID=A0ABQ7BZA1_BRACR|nr:hypothetical protein DY000_02007876 [Brassica cretica]
MAEQVMLSIQLGHPLNWTGPARPSAELDWSSSAIVCSIQLGGWPSWSCCRDAELDWFSSVDGRAGRMVDPDRWHWKDNSKLYLSSIDGLNQTMERSSSIGNIDDSNTKPSIDVHHTPDSAVQVKVNKDNGYLTLDEFDIFKDPEGQARSMDGCILNISREEISEIIAMNGSKNFLDMHNKAEDPPSIDEADAPSIDGQSEFRRRVLHQNRKRKPRWEMRNEYGISIVQEQDTYNKAEIYRAMRTTYDYHSKRLDEIYYLFDNSISWLTTCTDEMRKDIAMIQE